MPILEGLCRRHHREIGTSQAPLWSDPGGQVMKTPHGERRLDRKLLALSKPKLLIIEEFGYLPLEPDAAHLFFQLVSRQLVSRRYETGATVVGPACYLTRGVLRDQMKNVTALNTVPRAKPQPNACNRNIGTPLRSITQRRENAVPTSRACL